MSSFRKFFSSSRDLAKSAIDTGRFWIALKLMKESTSMQSAAKTTAYDHDEHTERLRQLRDFIEIRSDSPEFQREIMRDIHAMDRQALEEARSAVPEGMTLDDVVDHRARRNAIRIVSQEFTRPEEKRDWVDEIFQSLRDKCRQLLSSEESKPSD